MSKKFPKLPIELEPTEKPLESDSTLIAGLKVVYNDETLPKDEHNDQLVKNRKAMYRGELPPAKEEKAESATSGRTETSSEAATTRTNFVPPVSAEAGRAGEGDAVTGEEARRSGKPARNTETGSEQV